MSYAPALPKLSICASFLLLLMGELLKHDCTTSRGGRTIGVKNEGREGEEDDMWAPHTTRNYLICDITILSRIK
jgi:hypothetical protein